MSDSHTDPSANTQQFRAYMQSAEPEPTRRAPVVLIAGLVVAVAVVAVMIWLVTR